MLAYLGLADDTATTKRNLAVKVIEGLNPLKLKFFDSERHAAARAVNVPVKCRGISLLAFDPVNVLTGAITIRPS